MVTVYSDIRDRRAYRHVRGDKPMAVKITSDSTADLGALFAGRGIAVTPLTVLLGNRAGHDGTDITPDDIYAYFEETKTTPKTSAVSPEEYREFFAAQTADGSEVVHFTISSDMSACYENACAAAKEFGGVYVVDSRNLSTGIGLLVLYADDLAKSGRGGAVYNEGTFTLTNTSPSEIIISLNNNTAAYGGGIYQGDGVVSLSYLSMYGNSVTATSTSTGAAFYLEKGSAELFNTTIAGNVSNGAAIYTNTGSLTLTNTTLALNTGSQYGLFNSDATVMLNNTLVIGNGSTGYENIDGAYGNDGYSLVGTEENGYSAELIFGTNVFDPNTGVIALSTDAQNPALAGGTLYRDSAGNAYDQLGNDRTAFPGEGKYSIGAFTASIIITIKDCYACRLCCREWRYKVRITLLIS